MSHYDAQDYVNRAAEASVEWLSLTGGEPMIYPSLVENLVAYATKHGLRTELVTNCNWAETPEKSSGTLRRLMDAGLDVLNISADDFYQEYVPFRRVRNAYEAAKGIGLRMVVMSALSSGGGRLSGIAERLGDEIPAPGVEDQIRYAAIGIESGFTPVGSGAKLPRKEWFLSGSSLAGGCDAVLRDLGVKTNGDLIPCCSASAFLPSFTLGNLDDSNIPELLAKAWGSEVFRVLSEKGPMGLHDKPPNGVFVNKCHLCQETLKRIH